MSVFESSVDGVPLPCRADAGIAVCLSAPLRTDLNIEPDTEGPNAARVTGHAGSPWIVASRGAPSGIGSGLHDLRTSIERGLDAYSFQHAHPVTLVAERRVVEWETVVDGPPSFRIVDQSDFSHSRQSVSEVNVASSNWNPALRYWRKAMNSTDLHDCFRAVYLSFESALSQIAPMSTKPREGEGAWIKRGLRVVHMTHDLSPYVRHPATDEHPADQIHDAYYVSLRNGLFHAKVGRDILLPYERGEHDLRRDLRRLAELTYIMLQHALGQVLTPADPRVAERGGWSIPSPPSGARVIVVPKDPNDAYFVDATESRAAEPGGGHTLTMYEWTPARPNLHGQLRTWSAHTDFDEGPRTAPPLRLDFPLGTRIRWHVWRAESTPHLPLLAR